VAVGGGVLGYLHRGRGHGGRAAGVEARHLAAVGSSHCLAGSGVGSAGSPRNSSPSSAAIGRSLPLIGVARLTVATVGGVDGQPQLIEARPGGRAGVLHRVIASTHAAQALAHHISLARGKPVANRLAGKYLRGTTRKIDRDVEHAGRVARSTNHVQFGSCARRSKAERARGPRTE
nr:hypothetical protein [Tanacetum cinerariifolium]